MSIRLEYSVTAKCRPEHVWQKFEKLEEWPWWNHVIGKTQWLSGGRWQEGGRFMFEMLRPRHMTFKPVVIKSAPPNQIAWIGKAFGFRGEHWFSFEAQGDGTTVLKTWEIFSGPLTMFLGAGSQKKIVDFYADWLGALKEESEKIAREALARS